MPGPRRLRAKIAASARWMKPMARADQAATARDALIARLERQVDPARTLPDDEWGAALRINAAKRYSCVPDAILEIFRTLRAPAYLGAPQAVAIPARRHPPLDHSLSGRDRGGEDFLVE